MIELRYVDTNGYRCPCCMDTSTRRPVEVATEEEAKDAMRAMAADSGDQYHDPICLTVVENNVELGFIQKDWPRERRRRYNETTFRGHWKGRDLDTILEAPKDEAVLAGAV